MLQYIFLQNFCVMETTILDELQSMKESLNFIREQIENSTEDLLTSKQLMKELDISRNTMNRLMTKGILRPYRLGGKLFFFRNQVVKAIKDD